jgi:hypothetical protein
MNKILKIQIYAHVGGVRNKKHQNLTKGTLKKEIKNHKD